MGVPRRHVDAGQREQHDVVDAQQRVLLAQLLLDVERRDRIADQHFTHRLDQRDDGFEVAPGDREQIGPAGDSS